MDMKDALVSLWNNRVARRKFEEINFSLKNLGNRNNRLIKFTKNITNLEKFLDIDVESEFDVLTWIGISDNFLFAILYVMDLARYTRWHQLEKIAEFDCALLYFTKDFKTLIKCVIYSYSKSSMRVSWSYRHSIKNLQKVTFVNLPILYSIF